MTAILVVAAVIANVSPDTFRLLSAALGLSAFGEGAVVLLRNLTEGLVVILALAIYVERVSRRTIEARRATDITQQFLRAIDFIGEPDRAVRTAGVYALDQIARDSPMYTNAIVQILTAFVRQHAGSRDVDPSKQVEEQSPPPDLQAAVTVLGRGRWYVGGRHLQFQLGDLDLRQLDFRGLNLEGAQLRRSNLAGATLIETDLEGANLEEADLEGASLVGANLQRAFLGRARLHGAVLAGAHLEGANLVGADLTNAHLSGAFLRGADLYGADLTDAFLERADLREANLERSYNPPARISSADS
ncbi:MAG: pentapeptide repeat-containing protein [Candidatus Dormibacteraeota bacterium]|nr:pentapeptide repeat-containing protein [Candidatus Dormibacteraeota bacterium]